MSARELNPLRRALAEGRAIVAKAEAKILAHDTVALGGIAFSADEARAMIARGYRFIVLGSDAALIAKAARRMVQTIRG